MSKIESLEYVTNIGIKETIVSRGSSNKIHILNNGYKFKEFPIYLRNLAEPETKILKEELLKQTELESSRIILPEIVISDKKNLYGYISRYVQGYSIEEIDEETSIKELLDMIKVLEEEIMILSENKVRMYDVHEGNIIVNNNGMNIIDTDDYYLEDNITEQNILEIKENNLKAIFETIIRSIIPRINLSNAMSKQEIKYYYTLASQGRIKCSDFIVILLSSMRKKKIEDIAQLRKNI